VDISAGTPDLYYYCSAHSGMGGQIWNFAGATSYAVTVVYNATHSRNIYALNGSTEYYEADNLVFNVGTKYVVDISSLNGTSYTAVFGTVVDSNSSIVSDTSIVNQIGNMIYVNPQQTLYMFDQTTAFMTTPPPVYKNYRFKTSGTLTVNMTTDPVDIYLIGGGGGGGRRNYIIFSSGDGGNPGAQRIISPQTLSGVYTIQVGVGAPASGDYRSNNGGDASKTIINGPGINTQYQSNEAHMAGGGGGQYVYNGNYNGNNGQNGTHIGGLGAGGGGGSSNTSIGGTGGSIGGGRGGSTTYAATAGAANTGSGGGGGSNQVNTVGAAGGSGVVYIRLPEGKFSYTASYDEVAKFGDTTAI
jgi:hypothetical protein